MREARLVIVGNDYLAGHARRAGGRRREYLPTVIDASRYRVATAAADATYTIGWIGSPLTARYLPLVRDALAEVCRDERARVMVVGAGPVTLDSVPIEARPWSEATEVAELERFDVGIMPLPDGPWERGKCGYKLIQYMACGRPVVASPVGMSAQIVEHGVTGLLARTSADWVAALRALRDPALRARMPWAGTTGTRPCWACVAWPSSIWPAAISRSITKTAPSPSCATANCITTSRSSPGSSAAVTGCSRVPM